MKMLSLLCALVVGPLVTIGSVQAAMGPTQSPLKVTAMYTARGGGAIYVAFQAGAMPGCYGNAGGYLFPTNNFYKEVYAQIVMLHAAGGIKAAVVYTQNTPTGNWGDCTIDGLYLVPE